QGRRHLGTAVEGVDVAGRAETPLDQETFDSTLAAELAKGTDRRVAEGRARSKAVRAYRAAHPEETAAHAAPAAAAAGGNGEAAVPAAAAAPSGVPVAAAASVGAPVAAPLTAPVHQAPAPTGNVPEPKKGAPEKH